MNQTRFSKLLYGVLMFALVACQAQVTVPAVPTPAVPTPVSPTAAPSVAAAQALTTFSPKKLPLPIRFSFGPEWHIEEEYPDDVALLSTDGMELAFIVVKDVKVAGPAAPFAVGPFPVDFVTWIQAHGLFQVVEKQPARVAGFEGMQIDATATAACGMKKNWLFLVSTGWNCTTGQYFRFIDLPDVNGEHVLVMENTSPEAFAAGAEESQKVLDTVTFKKPTTFVSKTYQLPMSVRFGPDWQILDNYPDLVTVENKPEGWQLGFNLVNNAKLADPVDGHLVPFPDDFVTWIKSDPNLVAGEATEVRVGGFKGIQIDIRSTTTRKDFLFLKSGTVWNIDTNAIGRFILLTDVNGQRVFIWFVLNLDAGQFNLAAGQAQAILDTVTFAKPSGAVPAAYPQLIEYKIPTSASEPGGIVAGPDGALWFVETAVNKIGRISTEGVVTEYPVPTASAIDTDQGFLAVGPDGALWFNEDLVNKIGRITTTGQVTEFALPDELKPAQETDAPIRALVAGPDGALWITSSAANAIIKLTVDGKIAAQYTLPQAKSHPVGMVVGPDGALWFVEGVNQIGRMTLDGQLSEYALPDNSRALRITVGPDQALWFTLHDANKIGRISTDGKLTMFEAAGMGPVGIAAGADGALWFTGYNSSEIGRLTTDGVLTKLAIPTTASVPYHITAGPDGNLWFTEQQGNQIGQIQLSAP